MPASTQSNLFYGRKMIEFAALTFSFVTIFVLSSVTRNKRERRMNPKQLELAGYFLCGLLFASAAVLLLAAAQGRAALPYVSSKVNGIGELVRSDVSRVGKECVSTCRSR